MRICNDILATSSHEGEEMVKQSYGLRRRVSCEMSGSFNDIRGQDPPIAPIGSYSG